MLSYFSSPIALQMKSVWRGKDVEETGCAVAWLLRIRRWKWQKCEPGCWNGVWTAALHLTLGSMGICLWHQGFIAAFREHSWADPTIGHMLGPAVLAPLGSAAVTEGRFCTDRQVPRSSSGYKYSCAPVILKPILNHQKVMSTHVFSMLGLANILFLDCSLKKKNLAILKGKINFLSNIFCEGALQCWGRFSPCIFCFLCF